MMRTLPLLLVGLLAGCASTTPSVAPFLMFQNQQADEAIGFYTEVFPEARTVSVERYEEGEQGPVGSVKRGSIEIHDQRIEYTDSPIEHAFDFTPSFSFIVECESAERVDELATTLGEDGSVMMPPADYGFSDRFAWVQDRFGVSWQLNHAWHTRNAP